MEIEPYPSPIPYGRQSIDESDIEAVIRTLRSDFLAQGPQVEAFENALCEFVGVRHAIAVSSGTAALHLSCLGLGVGPGDKGVVPGITFAATANCLRYSGADVAFCDVDPKSGRANASHFSQMIAETQGVKVLLPVSYSGAVPDLPEISQLASNEGLFVIEDAAHSIGAIYGDGFNSGSCHHSDAAILSFHPVKHICSGEGGAVLTNNDVLGRRIRKLRSHGIEQKDRWLYDQADLGYHYRMTDLQAALGLSQLQRLPEFLALRKAKVRRYEAVFESEPFRTRITIAKTNSGSAHHLFVICFANPEERRAAYDFFHAHNVKVQVHYMPVYHHSYYKNCSRSPLSGVEQFYSTCLSLPLHPKLNDEEQDYVINCLRVFLEN